MDVAQDIMFSVPEEVWLLIFGTNLLPNFDLVYWRAVGRWNSILKNVFSKSPIWLLLLHDLRRYLTRKDVLVFRMVCKGWRDAMDTTLENLWAKPEFPWDIALSPFLSLPVCPQKSVLAIQALASDMKTFPRMKQSLAGRSMSLRITGEDNEDVITEYFRKYGDNIWDLKISVQDNSLERVREKFSKYFKHTPNLRRLEMVADVRGDFDADHLLNRFLPFDPYEAHRDADQPKFKSLKYLKMKSFFLNNGDNTPPRLIAISFPLYCRVFGNIIDQINILQLEGDFYNISPPNVCPSMDLALRFPTDKHFASLMAFSKALPKRIVLQFPDPVVDCQKLFRRLCRLSKFIEVVSGLCFIFDGPVRRDVISPAWGSSLSEFKQLKELVFQNGLLPMDPVQIQELPSLSYFVYRFNQPPPAEVKAGIDESARNLHSYMQRFSAFAHMGTENSWIMDKIFFTHSLHIE